MSKLLAVAALMAAFAVCGCKSTDKDEDMNSSPKKMSVDKSAKSSCQTCDKSAAK
jgi:hypothetical protein